jgi:hypothetical protein
MVPQFLVERFCAIRPEMHVIADKKERNKCFFIMFFLEPQSRFDSKKRIEKTLMFV